MRTLSDMKSLSQAVANRELTAEEAAAQIEMTREDLEDFYARFSPAAAEMAANGVAEAYHAIMRACFVLHPKEKQTNRPISIPHSSRPTKYFGNRDEREEDEEEERGGPLRHR